MQWHAGEKLVALLSVIDNAIAARTITLSDSQSNGQLRIQTIQDCLNLQMNRLPTGSAWYYENPSNTGDQLFRLIVLWAALLSNQFL